MGCALARWAALHGFFVRIVGRDGPHAMRAAGHLTNQASGIFLFDDLGSALQGADIIFEALPEALDQKADIWRAVQKSAPDEALLLTSSSSISLASIRAAGGLTRPIFGFHMFLPIDRMKAVEIVSEDGASEKTLAALDEVSEMLGKTPIHVKDQTGYAASRMALAMGLEAMRILEEGVADAAAIDSLMKHGYGHPCGPLELSDRIGLGLRLAIAQHLYDETGHPAFRPPAILESKVADGALGLLAGKGFYKWREGRIEQ
jgi:3-hydroxybutyryl-CoA dehydrogenase